MSEVTHVESPFKQPSSTAPMNGLQSSYSQGNPLRKNHHQSVLFRNSPRFTATRRRKEKDNVRHRHNANRDSRRSHENEVHEHSAVRINLEISLGDHGDRGHSGGASGGEDGSWREGSGRADEGRGKEGEELHCRWVVRRMVSNWDCASVLARALMIGEVPLLQVLALQRSWI